MKDSMIVMSLAVSVSLGLEIFVVPVRKVLLIFFAAVLHDYTLDVQTGTTLPEDVADAPDSIPVSWLARFAHRMCAPLPFDVEATTQEEVDRVVATKISQELHAVQSYSRVLHSRGAMQSAPPKNVEESTQERVREEVFPWPQIQEQAVPERADGRFAKSFPLKFPMGVADPWQPRLRSDFSFIDAVQHLFR